MPVCYMCCVLCLCAVPMCYVPVLCAWCYVPVCYVPVCYVPMCYVPGAMCLCAGIPHFGLDIICVYSLFMFVPNTFMR